MLRFADANSLNRHRAWLAMRPTDRPLLACQIGFMVPSMYPRLWDTLPRGSVGPEHIRIDAFLADVEDLFRRYAALGDDMPFVAVPFLGVPWVEAIVGCPIVCTDSSMCAEPALTGGRDTIADVNGIRNNPWFAKLVEMMTALVDRSAGRFPVAPSLMRGPADVLCALRGPVRFALDFYDHLEAVRTALRGLADAWMDVAQAQLDFVAPSSDGYVGSGSWRIWGPDRVIWLQEDAMALLSPALYREFVLPEDRRILSRFPCTAFHLHASALWAVDPLLQLPELGALELNFESARLDEAGTLTAWKRIQRTKPLIAWKEFNGEAFWPWLDDVLLRLGPSGPLFAIVVKDVNEGLLVKERIFHIRREDAREPSLYSTTA
jgi:hypothetical protein